MEQTPQLATRSSSSDGTAPTRARSWRKDTAGRTDLWVDTRSHRRRAACSWGETALLARSLDPAWHLARHRACGIRTFDQRGTRDWQRGGGHARRAELASKRDGKRVRGSAAFARTLLLWFWRCATGIPDGCARSGRVPV